MSGMQLGVYLLGTATVPPMVMFVPSLYNELYVNCTWLYALPYSTDHENIL